MGMNANQHNIGLPSRFFYLVFYSQHIRLIRRAFDSVLFSQHEHAAPERHRSFRKRVAVTQINGMLLAGIDLGRLGHRFYHAVMLLIHMIRFVKTQWVETRASRHIGGLPAGHCRLMERGGGAD
ncbi:hypothetical protein D3C75_806510 [compost metagenome]